MDKYGKELLNIASKLDALTDANTEITELAKNIIEGKEEMTTRLLAKIENVVESGYSKEIKKVAAMLENKLVGFYGHKRMLEICKQERRCDEGKTHSLPELLNELNELIGLEKVKSTVNDLITYQKIQKLRRENDLFSKKNTMHLAFMGNPGTGKTTVARIVGHIYRELNLLTKGHFIEVSRTDLIAGYQGQTALKVKNVIERAKGGVLFIDEAYSITENENSDSYGRECLTELTKALEDFRDDLVVIVAGYTNPMKQFFEANPGLKSRFNTFIEFDDYNAEELEKILYSICEANDYRVENNAKKVIHSFFEEQIINKDENFANGRLARNLFDVLVMNHARRVLKIQEPSLSDLEMIKEEDAINI